MLEKIVRGWMTKAAILISLLVLGTGLGTWLQPWVFVGPVVGGLGAGLAYLALRREWPPLWGWLLVGVVLAGNIAVLVLILSRATLA